MIQSRIVPVARSGPCAFAAAIPPIVADPPFQGSRGNVWLFAASARLNLIERYSGLDVDRKFGGVVRRDPVQPCQTNDAIRTLQRISELQLGARADGNNRSLLRRDEF